MNALGIETLCISYFALQRIPFFDGPWDYRDLRAQTLNALSSFHILGKKWRFCDLCPQSLRVCKTVNAEAGAEGSGNWELSCELR